MIHKWKVQAGADANLKDASSRRRNDPAPIRGKISVPHGEVQEVRQHPLSIESHSVLPPACWRAAKPPATWATFSKPISFNVFAARDERLPDPQ